MSDSTAADTWQEGIGPREALFPVRPHLFVVLECSRPWAGGARHSLSNVDEVIVGRGPERSATRETVAGVKRLVVRLPGPWLSSTHARFVRAEGRWVVEDAGSKNGSAVNGVAIQRAPLVDGDVVDLGRTILVLRSALPTPPGTLLDADAPGAGQSEAPSPSSLVPLAMSKLHELLRVARSSVPILLLGETGTGKEVLARAVHAASGRTGELVAVNCGALTSSLLEGLLFGHVRGAFSGAVRDELGLVRAADGGTLLLDEIGDLPKPAQAALLRVIQEREVVPVGAVRPLKVDVRFVAATHRPLEELSASGEFRQDLFARLNGFLHLVPPLRERREDLGLLVGALLARSLGAGAKGTSLSVEAGRALLAYPWPANIRELEQCLARATALAATGVIEAGHLPDAITGRRTAPEPKSQPPLSEPDELLRAKLVGELRAHGGNVSEVARSMRKARMQIQRWLKRLGIDATDYR